MTGTEISDLTARIGAGLETVCETTRQHATIQSIVWAAEPARRALEAVEQAAQEQTVDLKNIADVVHGLSRVLRAHFDSEGAPTAEAVGIVVARVVEIVTCDGMNGIETFCSRTCDSRLHAIVVQAVQSDTRKWASAAFQDTCRLLLRSIVREARATVLQSQLLVRFFARLAEKWHVQWGYDCCNLPLEPLSFDLIEYTLGVHLREMLFCLSESIRHIDRVGTPEATSDEKKQVQRILLALENLDRIAASLLQRSTEIE